MAIAKTDKVGGGNGSGGKAIYYAPPNGAYPAVITDIEATMEKKYEDRNNPNAVLEPKFRFTFKFISHKRDELWTKVPRYEFQQDLEEGYNPYGKTAWKSITRAFSAPRVQADGTKSSASNLYKWYVDILNGGKELTAEQIAAVKADPSLLNAFIGKKVLVTGINALKDGGPGSGFNIKAVASLGADKFVASNYPDLQPVTFLLTPEQLADKSPPMNYVDTGEVAYGYHIRKNDGSWKFVTREEAANSSIERYGDFYSPTRQRELRAAGEAATAAAPAAVEEEEALPF